MLRIRKPRKGAALVALVVSVLLFPAAALSQYMYLDSNSNGIHDSGDSLNPNGTPTVVDAYIVTNRDRENVPCTCNSDTSVALTILSYLVHLRANYGTVTYSDFVDRTAFGTQFDSVTTSDVVYKNGRGGSVLSAGGPYRLFTLTITGQSGAPEIAIVDGFEAPVVSGEETSFGSSCQGNSLGDNTYRLAGPITNARFGAGDWSHADGLGPAESDNAAPEISAPDSVIVAEGDTVSISATASDSDIGQTVSITGNAPAFLTLMGSGYSPSLATARADGTPSFSDSGLYEIVWTATDNGSPPEATTASTILVVQNTDRPPTVRVPATAEGSASDPITFTVGASDPDGDAIQGLGASGMPPGATLTAESGTGSASFRWVPDPSTTGDFVVGFNAQNAGGQGTSSTTITVKSPTGPRRPRVDPDLLNLQPGMLRSERILTHEDGETYANLFLVGDATTQDLSRLGVQVNTRMGRVMTARAPLSALPSLFDAPNMDAVVAPGSCQLLLDSTTVKVEAAGIRTLPYDFRPIVGRTGAGVIIGTVDTGIDVHHPDFLKISGSTRLVSYWNQTRNDPSRFPPYQGLQYGTEWLPADIDGYVINNWAADSMGHGTHVAGIALGNAEAYSPCLPGPGPYPYLGIAPEADLCAVKALARSDFKNTTVLETRIVDAINYIFRKAGEPPTPKPAVVNVSLGSQWGPHDGRSWLDWWVNNLISDSHASSGLGRIVVAAAGNDANTGVHAKVQAKQGVPQEATLEVGQYTPGGRSGKYIRLLGWHNEQDSLWVTVVTPNGEVVGPTFINDGTIDSTADGSVQICHGEVCYSSAHLYPGTWSPDVPFYVELTDQSLPPIASGTWHIQVGATNIGSSGLVDIYLVQADLGGANTPLVQFVVGADSNRTITSPASADSVIAVGGYSTKECWKHTNGAIYCKSFASATGAILDFSSRGPRRDGRTKPDLCAPGAMVVASKSYASFLGPSPAGDTTQVVIGGSYVAQAGTSMSAPHVAGAVALMLGRTDASPDSAWRTATPSKILQRLKGAARSDAFTGSVPNDAWGAGKLDIRAALAPVMGLRFTEPGKGTVFNSHWGQASILGDSTTFDSVVVRLSLNGCDFSERVAKLTSVGPAGSSNHFLFYAPSATTKAKLLATAYAGPNKVQAISDSVFIFNVGTSAAVADEGVPKRLALYNNAPNPFNPSTTIRLDVPRPGPVTLRIFGVDGRLVRTLISQILPAGSYSVRWYGDNEQAEPVASGIYLYELRSGGERLNRKMALAR